MAVVINLLRLTIFLQYSSTKHIIDVWWLYLTFHDTRRSSMIVFKVVFLIMNSWSFIQFYMIFIRMGRRPISIWSFPSLILHWGRMTGSTVLDLYVNAKFLQHHMNFLRHRITRTGWTNVHQPGHFLSRAFFCRFSHFFVRLLCYKGKNFVGWEPDRQSSPDFEITSKIDPLLPVVSHPCMLSETLHSLKVLITFETLEPPDNRVFLLAVGVERLLMLEADAADDALVRFLLALTAPVKSRSWPSITKEKAFSITWSWLLACVFDWAFWECVEQVAEFSSPWSPWGILGNAGPWTELDAENCRLLLELEIPVCWFRKHQLAG